MSFMKPTIGSGTTSFISYVQEQDPARRDQILAAERAWLASRNTDPEEREFQAIMRGYAERLTNGEIRG